MYNFHCQLYKLIIIIFIMIYNIIYHNYYIKNEQIITFHILKIPHLTFKTERQREREREREIETIKLANLNK
jgi:hypothetical protein